MEEIQLLVQVSIMYYDQGYTQQQIAAKLNITRQTVSRLLREARMKGIVDIRIHNPIEEVKVLSDKLKQIYGVRNAIVIPSGFEDEELTRAIIAQRAAKYIEELLEKGYKNIAISWGKTIYHTISYIESNPMSVDNSDVNIYPLIGASNHTAPQYMINEMVREMAKKFNATPLYAYIPADPVSKEDVTLFKRTSAYKNMKQLWENADAAIVGIGIGNSNGKQVIYNHPGERTQTSQSIIGDICTHYFDIEGNFEPRIHGELLCASVEDLKKIKSVVAIAGGINKVKAIHGALKTNVVTDIITDEVTCNSVLKFAKKNQ